VRLLCLQRNNWSTLRASSNRAKVVNREAKDPLRPAISWGRSRSDLLSRVKSYNSPSIIGRTTKSSGTRDHQREPRSEGTENAHPAEPARCLQRVTPGDGKPHVITSQQLTPNGNLKFSINLRRVNSSNRIRAIESAQNLRRQNHQEYRLLGKSKKAPYIFEDRGARSPENRVVVC